MLPLLLAFWLVPQDQPPQKCTLSGTVVNSATGEPVTKAELTLSPLVGGQQAGTVSGERGVFSLIDLAPGDYHLRGERTGYISTAYNAKLAGSAGAVIHLEPGQERTGLTLKLIPGGIISGTVRDSDGEPLEDARVMLARRIFDQGELRIEGVDSTDTDDRGQYRFRKLVPGKYFVSAEKQHAGWNLGDHSPKTSGSHYDLVPTLYPGAIDLASATGVEVAGSKETSGIDIKLLTAPVFRVSGQVLAKNTPGGVMLIPADPLRDFGDYGRNTSVNTTNGEFEFRMVPAGSYVAQASGSFAGSAAVEVGSQDVENLRLVPVAPATLKGRIRIDGGGELAHGALIWIANEKHRGPFLTVTDDQTFSTNQIQPGKYHAYISSLEMRTRFYVETIRGEAVDEATGKLTISPGAAVSIEIVLGKDGAEVTGTVNYKDDDPPSFGTVALIPDGPMHGRADRYYITEADQFGAFRIVNVAPGKYKAFAWDEVQSEQWFDPEFIDKYWKSAGTWEVQPNGHLSLGLSLLHTAAR